MKKLIILSLITLFVVQSNAQIWDEVAKVVNSDRWVSDRFGYSISTDGVYAIVGARLEDEDAGGANNVGQAGSAYLFEKDSSGVWVQVQKVVAPDRLGGDEFGRSVSISGDYAIVGAQYEDEDSIEANTLINSGSAYLFERDSGSWNLAQKIVASDRASFAEFAQSVAISGDYVIVGAWWEEKDAAGANPLSFSGAAYVFERDGGGNWNQVQKLVASDRELGDEFGHSVTINGTYAVVGALRDDEDAAGANPLMDAGSAYIFEYCGTSDTVTINSCMNYVSPSGTYIWDSTGTYLDTIPNAAACDSVITIYLTIGIVSSKSVTHSSCNSYQSPS